VIKALPWSGFCFTRSSPQVAFWQKFALRIWHFMGSIADDCLSDLETETEGILGQILRFSD
jgi:hypothetical protein